MTPWYWMMVPLLRPVAASPADGEILHQSVLDRHALMGDDYAPDNLKPFLQGSPPTVTTLRIARGTPCQ
jgi:hypothetical protein